MSRDISLQGRKLSLSSIFFFNRILIFPKNSSILMILGLLFSLALSGEDGKKMLPLPEHITASKCFRDFALAQTIGNLIG
ncbi:hypothetical protein PUN28_013991 [Cardiocondyla obscurior]|uniref:Uncharacterized protein n=1 Tax=Cardiocondyla obscurior TaxID=286306 RepID=A0AAW2F3Y0_9HYME